MYMDNNFSLNINVSLEKHIMYSIVFLAMIEKWKKAVDNGNVFRALVMDLSKAFDCLPHDLMIAQLKSCNFNLTALNLIHNYLAKRK